MIIIITFCNYKYIKGTKVHKLVVLFEIKHQYLKCKGSSSGPDLPIGYVGLSLGCQGPRGLQQTVVRIESITGLWSVR